MCSSRFRTNRTTSQIPCENVAKKSPRGRVKNSTLNDQRGMLISECARLVRMKNLFKCRGRFCRGDFLPFRLRKKSGNTPEKSAASYPLPDPPLVANCSRAFRADGWSSANWATPRRSIPSRPTKSRRRTFTGLCFASCWATTSHAGSRAGAGGIVDEFARWQNVDVQAAEKSALERRRAADGGRRGVHLATT